MTYEEAVDVYDYMLSDGNEKEFLNLLLIQAKRNISEVIGRP